ncbi:MAG TPA: hypothetical protein VF526_06885 [Solirubrobacteraceae bacterium]|jgi:hypothetical protein
MSITYTCNVCGETIEGGSPRVVLNADGERSADHWRSGWIGHYHADPSAGCWQRILDVIRAADGRAPRLDSIPTALDKSIADARRKHRREHLPAQDDESPTDDGKRTEEGPQQV